VHLVNLRSVQLLRGIYNSHR